MKLIFNKKIIILFVSILLVSVLPKTVFAVWSGTFYNPGETLNPECLPSDVDCDVLSPLTSTNISDTAYDEATWNGVTTITSSKNAIRDKIEILATVSHNAITLGTANGLSLSTQELSLGLASTSTTGALSNTDWNIFNNKAPALGVDDNYVTDAQLVIIGNTSGTNSGNNATNTQYSGLATSKADVGQTMYIGTTAHVLNRTSATEVLTGITGLTPNANFVLTQNGIVTFTSEETGAVTDTLYLKAGNVGIGTTTPTNILSLGNLQAQKIWIENTDNLTAGRALTLAAGSTVNTGDAGDFVALSQTSRNWYAMTAASNGNIYAAVYNGDIYMQTSGTGNFVALSQTSRQWHAMTTTSNGNVYAAEYGGDIYMQTGGTGDFVALSQTTRGWVAVTAASNGNVYAAVYGGDIYMQTGGIDDLAGGNLILSSGRGKGAGASSISFLTGTTLSSGTTLQTLSEKMTILGNGNLGIGTTAPSELLSLGLTGTIKGVLSLAGVTSGKVIIQPADVAGTWTMTLPTAVGGAGQQLTDVASNGITSWTAAGSSRELKDIIEIVVDPNEALIQILQTPIYRFHYKPGMGTGDSITEYVGVIADEAPWAMHYNGTIVNPVNTLGYMVLGIQAMNEKIVSLDLKLNNLSNVQMNTDTFSNISSSLIKQFFENIENGIMDLYASIIHSDKVETKEFCIEDVCITKEELLKLKNDQNIFLQTSNLNSNINSNPNDSDNSFLESINEITENLEEINSEENSLTDIDSVDIITTEIPVEEILTEETNSDLSE